MQQTVSFVFQKTLLFIKMRANAETHSFQFLIVHAVLNF